MRNGSGPGPSGVTVATEVGAGPPSSAQRDDVETRQRQPEDHEHGESG